MDIQTDNLVFYHEENPQKEFEKNVNTPGLTFGSEFARLP